MKHGLYDFSARAGSQPATAVERAERRKESFGYPPLDLGPQQLDHHGSREGITLGPLAGYAVLYRLVAQQGGKTFPDLLAAHKDRVLVIHLTDGCISFETTIALQSSSDRDPWSALDSILSEVTIEKSRGAPPGPRVPQAAATALS